MQKENKQTNKHGNSIDPVVLCNFAETLIVISKEENTSYRSRCTMVKLIRVTKISSKKEIQCQETKGRGSWGGFNLYYFVNTG